MKSFLSLLLLIGLCGYSGAGDKVLESGLKINKVASGCKFTEGPVVDAKGILYFSDRPNDRIMRIAAKGKLTIHRRPCGAVNGMTMDAKGRMVICQSAGDGGKRRVVRIELDGRETVLADTYKGKRFIAPNDVCIARTGQIYFTDPWYGSGEKSQPTSGVYRIDAPGKVKLLIKNLQKPNGIVLSPKGKWLYVSDRGTQKLHRYRVMATGDLKPDGIVYNFSPDRGIDGMRVDVKGNIYGAAGQGKTTGLFVISPKGKLLKHLPMPEFSTNVVFGGRDMRDLYITASKSVYHVRTKIAGAPVGPQQ